MASRGNTGGHRMRFRTTLQAFLCQSLESVSVRVCVRARMHNCEGRERGTHQQWIQLARGHGTSELWESVVRFCMRALAPVKSNGTGGSERLDVPMLARRV